MNGNMIVINLYTQRRSSITILITVELRLTRIDENDEFPFLSNDDLTDIVLVLTRHTPQ